MAARRRSLEERVQIVEDFQKSGLMQREFCARHGLNINTLQNWLYSRHASKTAQVTTTTAPFARVVRTPDNGMHTEHALRLDLPGGVALRLAELPSATYVAKLCRLIGC